MNILIVICISSLWFLHCTTAAKQKPVPADCLLTHPACKSANCTVVDPNNCHQYIICKPEMRPDCGQPYIGHVTENCENDMFYDETQGQCVDTYACPSNTTIIKPCREHEEKYPISRSCTKYKVCVNPQNAETGSWEDQTCPKNHWFNSSESKCVVGKCPGCYEAAPDYANCDENKPGQSFGHIYDCRKYFTCELNPDDCAEGKWGRMEKQCPPGRYFDGNESCIEGRECPQICHQRADNDTECETEGQIISDCYMGVECVNVKTCPEACYEAYWGIMVLTCPDGMFYDANTRECVDTYVCPTDPTVTKKCIEDETKIAIPESCTRYKVCRVPQNSGSGFWDEAKCPPNQHFDSSQKMCIDGRCPGCYEEAPLYAKCDENKPEHTFGDLEDCSKYYKCKPNPDKCEEGKWGQVEMPCPPDTYFDGNGSCVESQECPHICLTKADSNLGCQTDGQKLLQDDCRTYITCKEEKRPECGDPYMGYETGNCVDEMFYDENSGKCVDTFACPTNSTIKISCSVDGATFAVVGSCTKYQVCVVPQNTGSGKWQDKECSTNQHFDSSQGHCVDGRCPGCFDTPPDYAKCGENKAEHRFGHLQDCTKYFICQPNGEWCEEGEWGQLEKQCPPGEFFDGKGSCVREEECPQICLPRADNTIGCSVDGEIKESSDCKSATECVRVKTCPETSYEEYWGKREIICTGDNQFYSKQQNECVEAAACPQSDNKEVGCKPKWDFMGTNPFAGDKFKRNLGFCRFATGNPDEPYKYGLWRKGNGCQTPETTYNTYELLSADNPGLELAERTTKRKAKLATNAFGIPDWQFVVCEKLDLQFTPGVRYTEENYEKYFPRFIEDRNNTNKECGKRWHVILCK